MAAQSGKQFQDILCEGRAHPVDSSDPVTAKTIDDLKKQVSKQKTEIEAEKTKFRELQRSHEKEIRVIREQTEKKLDRSLDALSHRKYDEKMAEVAQVKERLLKQNQQELRTQRAELEEEMRRLERRLTREREESMRKVLDLERKRTEEELSHYLPEESVMTREEHLKAEIFRLGVEVERLEFQLSNLQRENREQINVIKKVTQEHKAEVENLKKKNQADAARDLAQIRLAEQIIQEKERHIQEEEYRVDITLMEKEALAEELVNLKSRKTLEAVSRDEAVMSPTSMSKRVSMGSGGGVLQRRVEELEGTVRKLDEERRQLKQENASLRKAAVKEGGGSEGDAKSAEEKLKRLRKRNAELVALARQLDDKTKTLKMENEQLKLSGGVASSVGGGMEKGKGGGGESDIRKGSMSLSRQHAKDISEYTKQILTKDRELDSIRIRLAKYEVNGKARYEPAPEMEARVRSMAMERLKMEKVMVQLYSKVNDPLDVGTVTKQEMANESKEMQRVFDENKSLREQVELLKSQARMEDVDHVPESPSLVKQHSVPVGGGKVVAGSEGIRLLMEKNSKLEARIAALEKCEIEVGRLETALREVETAKTLYEQQNRRLTQQLKDAQQLAKEMDVVQETCIELEKEVTEVKDQLNECNSKISQLEKSYKNATESLNDARQEADSLRSKVSVLEDTLRDKQDEIRQLASELKQQQEQVSHQQTPPSPPPTGYDITLQTSFTASTPEKPSTVKENSSEQVHQTLQPSSTASGNKRVKELSSSTGERRVKSSTRSKRVKSPVKRVSGVNEADVSLDNEMRLAGFEMTDPYDSSEGLGFSDTNLDGSSLLSLEEDGLKKNVVDDGCKIEGGGSEAVVTRPHEPPSEHQRVAWLEGDGERLVQSSEGSGDGVRTIVEISSASEPTTAAVSHDISRESHDIDGASHDIDGASHDTVSGSHDIDGASHDTVSGSHDIDVASHDIVSESHDVDGVKTNTAVSGRGDDGIGGIIDLEDLAEPDSAEELVSSTSDIEPTTIPKNTDEGDTSTESAVITSDPTTVTTTAAPPNTVSVYIAKYSYIPTEMSPNPNYEQELSIKAGDYLYIFGEMDNDGFYLSQLVTGETGLVPSNFVEKVEDGEGDASVPHPSRFGSRGRRVSDLQDIPEMDEDISTSSNTDTPSSSTIPPPCNLELERQFVENDKYTVVIQWASPPSLNKLQPDSIVTYHTYVNGQLKEVVAGSVGIMSAQLRDIPRKQLVKISVRTVTDDGESPDPKKMVILNPQYPGAPTKVQVSLLEEPPLSPTNILVEWSPSRILQVGAVISGYVILINGHQLTSLQSSVSPTDTVCAKLTKSHLETLSLLPEERLVLTVRAVSDQYQSLDSVPIVVPRELFNQVMAGSNKSKVTRESLDTSHVESEQCHHHVTQADGYVTQGDNHVTSNGPRVNGSMEGHNSSRNDPTGEEEIDGVIRKMIKGETRYYMATFSYNPTFHSPNEEEADDELAFRDGDVITACSEVDEEGFFEGMLRGKKGLVPSNMVELISDPDKLINIQQLLTDQQCRSPDPLSHLPTVNGGDSSTDDGSLKMRALYKYDPIIDSPNDNKEDELCIEDGDIITVFGKPDEDGYYQGELKGKRGLVPSNFLEVVEEGSQEGEGVSVRKGSMGALGMEIFAASEEDMEEAKRIIAEASDSLKRSGSLTSSDNTKHKKGLFSKGKNRFSKGVGKK